MPWKLLISCSMPRVIGNFLNASNNYVLINKILIGFGGFLKLIVCMLLTRCFCTLSFGNT